MDGLGPIGAEAEARAAAPAPAPGAPTARSVRATVLFASLAGFTALSSALGPERAYLIVTGCLRLLDGIARRHGGSVDKYLGDSLMVVFGHPVPVARPARAAVAAALEMRAQVVEYQQGLALPSPLELHVGVATGPLVAGDVRGRVVREFHVLGDTVNVAARLKAKAPAGSIYVSEATRTEAGPGFAFRALEPLALKGKSRRVAACELLEEITRRHDRVLGREEAFAVALVGRDAELARLRAAAERLAAGRGGAVALLGEEGMGKSRLLAELGTAPALAGVDVLLARPGPRGGATPHGVIAALLAAARDDAAAPTEAPAPLPPPADALRRVLETARRPVLVAVEDLERADPESLDALAALLPLAASRPLLFLWSGHPASGAAAGALLERSRAVPGFEALALPPLGAEETERLIDAAAGAEVSAEARRLIRERAGGNPARVLLGVHLAPALATESEQAVATSERSSDAERRRATIVFADITGFTAMTEKLGAERAYPIVSGCLHLLDDVARRHGGHVDKYLGDCVMATFGVPEAIEDAPRAAVNAAIEMRQRVRAYNEERNLESRLDVHIGIHTGLGIAGDVSGPLLREFAVMGDPVELAQRLTDLAEAGQIFVGGDTHRLVRDAFAFASVDPVALGEPDPGTEVFELRSERVQLHRGRPGAGRRVFSALVGRDAELAALRAHLGRLRDGRGALVSLLAEAGVGKSRLVAELARSPEAEGAVWLEGRSLSTGRNLAFHPFADLLRSWSAIGDEDDDEAARAKLEQAVAALLPEEAAQTTMLLAALIGLHLGDEEQARLARIAGDAREKLLRRALMQLLERASALAPVVVVMDDFHWADASSVETLEALLPIACRHRVFFLCVARPGFPATSGRLGEAARAVPGLAFEELRLAPLTHGAARQLVNNLFEPDALPHATRAAIEARAQGNPFFIEEVVRGLLDAGAVELRDGRFRATDRIHEAEIPGTIHEVIQARVDRLPLRRRGLLQTAAVIGRSFHEEVLGAVAAGAAGLADDLRELEAAEFVVPWDQTRGVEWAFKHPLIQEVTYDALLETRREELHRQVARAIEAHLPADVPGRTGMLAYHFGMGREAERAEEHLFRAGEEAARLAASSEALHFFEEASKLYLQLHGEGGDSAKKALLERNVALALFNRGRLTEAVEHYDHALEHLGERIPRSERQRMLGLVRNLAAVLADLYLPARTTRKRAAIERDRQLVELLWERAQAETTTFPTRFVADSMGVLARIDRIDARTIPRAGSRFAGAVGIFSYGGLSFALSRRFLERAERLVSPDDPTEQLAYRAMRFVHHTLEGDWSDAHRVDEALLAEGLRYGQLWEVTNTLNFDGVRRVYQGDFGGARERIEQLAKIAEQYRHDLAASAGQFLSALLHLERRELDAAIAALDHYADEHPEAAFKVSALGHRAVAQWLGGDVEGAEATLARAGRLATEAGRVMPYHLSSYLRARQILDAVRLEQALASGDRRARREAARRARASRRAALRAASRVAARRPEVLRTAGTEAWLLGDRRAARAAWARSMAAADRLGMPAERARTRREMARRLRSAGDETRAEAEGLLAAAGAELAALGLDPETP